MSSAHTEYCTSPGEQLLPPAKHHLTVPRSSIIIRNTLSSTLKALSQHTPVDRLHPTIYPAGFSFPHPLAFSYYARRLFRCFATGNLPLVSSDGTSSP